MDVSRNLPTSDEFLRALGLARARNGSEMLNGIAFFGAGLLVGAGLALLFAPASGAEVREKLSARLDDVRDRVAGGCDVGGMSDASALP